MSQTIRVIRALRTENIEWLGDILSIEGELAVDTNHIWLRFRSPTATCKGIIDSVPGEHFEQDEAKRLRKLGQEVSTMLLPELMWQTIPDAVELALPTPSLAGELRTDDRMDLVLARSSAEQTPVAGLIDFHTLLGWVDRAPEIRLSQLRFSSRYQISQDAASTPQYSHGLDRQNVSLLPDLCLVIGTPLPSVPCRFLCYYHRTLIPSGFHWSPNVHISFVESRFGLTAEQWLLWLDDNQWYILSDNDFAPLTRAAMRSLARSRRSTC